MNSMASAVIGSTITTLGSSFFLLFCTMAIFVKLALVLFAVTFFAMVFSLAALPSVLLCIGPLGICGSCGKAEMVQGMRIKNSFGLRKLVMQNFQGSDRMDSRTDADRSLGHGNFETTKSEVFLAANQGVCGIGVAIPAKSPLPHKGERPPTITLGSTLPSLPE